MEEQEQIDTYPKVVFKVGEIIVDVPLLLDMGIAEKHLKMIIQTLKQEVMKDKAFQDYLKVIDNKKRSSTYTG